MSQKTSDVFDDLIGTASQPPTGGGQPVRGQLSTSISSDFGDFHSAPTSDGNLEGERSAPATHYNSNASSRPLVNQPANLDDTDLLGSFDDIQEYSRPPSTVSGAQTQDYLTDEPEPELEPDVDLMTSPPRPSRGQQATPPAMRRPSVGRIDSSPTRLRHVLSYPGPSSPPRVSEAGSEIIFHAPQIRGKDDAARRMRRMSQDFNLQKGHPHQPSSSSDPLSRFADTISTSKLASRWKRSVLGPSPGQDPADGPTKTALPIDITHKSPFASIDQIAGSYTAPDGAPGFRTTGASGHLEENESFQTTLVGRRELTTPVLDTAQAQELRSKLPPRQRISDSWTLLFSLDQHGASLSTLYRQVEQYAKDHRTSGNLLVVRDTEGHTFGIYLNEPLIKREGTYYGSGESFMFKFVTGESSPRIFRWTGRNQYIALCETTFISFGGGGASYGLILDGTFSRNSSSTSPAFQNEVLCVDAQTFTEKGQPFDCLGLEVWGLS